MPSSAAPSSPIADAVRSARLDFGAVVKCAEEVLADPICWFGVRHHSPAIARQLDRCIRERRPKIIFIEGPSEAQEMIEYVIDAKTRPPVAIYSSYRDDRIAPSPDQHSMGKAPPRISAWYPIVSYSP